MNDDLTQAQRDQHTAALRREYDGYITRGLDDRADQVATQLAQLNQPNKPATTPRRRSRKAGTS